jgi:hypothetical protein
MTLSDDSSFFFADLMVSCACVELMIIGAE